MSLASLKLLLTALLAAMALSSCTIEPPLMLSSRDDVEVRFGEIIIDLNVVWDMDADWQQGWWYGWDDTDISHWGKIEYPAPASYELRLYYLGRESPDADYLTVSSYHLATTRFRKVMDYGYHNVLAWSNPYAVDDAQALVVDETDPANVYATTTRVAQLNRTTAGLLNAPEVLYSGYERGFQITHDPADYDYYLEEEGVWVKQLNAYLSPRVYIYLVQVIIYNNHGRVTGVTDYSVVSGLAAAVQLHTGRTSYNDTQMPLEMRLKHDLPAPGGRRADIIGGRLNAFGLCDMEGWALGRSSKYEGSRTDLANTLRLGLRFASTDSVYAFDLTDQMRSHTHGGVLTVEIDADTLTVPTRPSGGVPAGGFDPTIVPTDSVEHIFTL